MKKILAALLAFVTTNSAFAFDLSTVCFRDVKPDIVYIGRIVVRGNSISIDYQGKEGNWSGLTGSFPNGEFNPNADGFKATNLTMSSADGSYTITSMNIEVTPAEVKLWQHGDRPKVHPRIPCP